MMTLPISEHEIVPSMTLPLHCKSKTLVERLCFGGRAHLFCLMSDLVARLPSPPLPPFLPSWSGNLTVSDAHARMTLGADGGSEEFEHGQITLRLKFHRFEVDPAAAVKWSA